MAELTARMNTLGLNESVHAGGPNNSLVQKAAYIPPHARAKMQAQATTPAPAPAPAAQHTAPATNGVNGPLPGSRWASAPTPAERLVVA